MGGPGKDQGHCVIGGTSSFYSILELCSGMGNISIQYTCLRPETKEEPEFGQLILVRSKREHKFQDKGELAIMMGFYPKNQTTTLRYGSKMDN